MNSQLARIALVLGLVATLLIGCQPLQPISQDAPLDESAEAEFLDAVMAAETALQSEDPVQAASYYTDDAVSMPPGFPPSHGKETIQGDLEFYFDSFDIERDFKLVDYDNHRQYRHADGQMDPDLDADGRQRSFCRDWPVRPRVGEG